MCLTAKNFGLKEENISISKLQGKTTNKKKLDGYHRKRERDEWTQNRERGRKDTVIYQKGG